MMHYYDGQHFVHEAVMKNQITVVHIATKVLCDNGLKNVTGIQEVDGCYIYPAEFFCPINVTTGRIHVEKNTRTIHHYAGTWVDKKFSLKEVVKRIIPEKLLLALFGLKAKLKINNNESIARFSPFIGLYISLHVLPIMIYLVFQV